MNKTNSKIENFLVSENGTTSVEYAVMLALIIGLCIAAITAVGGENGSIWGENANQISNAAN